MIPFFYIFFNLSFIRNIILKNTNKKETFGSFLNYHIKVKSSINLWKSLFSSLHSRNKNKKMLQDFFNYLPFLLSYLQSQNGNFPSLSFFLPFHFTPFFSFPKSQQINKSNIVHSLTFLWELEKFATYVEFLPYAEIGKQKK